jgi:hypothetical protein
MSSEISSLVGYLAVCTINKGIGMNIALKRLVLGMTSAGLLALYGCGGGSSSAANNETPAGVVVATTDVSLTVIDGPIENAQVCLDINNNSVCDANEPTGKTDATGKVTIKVNSADVGKYPVIAVVGTDAIDADTGLVPTPFTMKAPADQTAVITPLTTLVHNHMVSTGSTSAAAADVVKAQTGINVSLFEDFSKGATDDHKAAANIARMVVVTTQEQTKAVKDAPTTDVSGGAITKEDLDKAIQKRLMEMLPQMVALLSDPAVQDALKTAQAKIDAASGAAKTTAQTEKDALIKTPAANVVVSNGLSKDAVATAVAVNKQQESTTPVVAETPAAGFNIRDLSFTNLSNYYLRFMSGTALQNTPDSKGNVRYVDNRYKSVDSVVAAWNTGSSSNPARQADLHWNGTAWVGCQLNFESVSSVRDAKGNSDYNYCDNLETGKSSRASLNLSGKKMVDALGDAVKAGYTNLGTVSDGAKALLGEATFPDKSAGFYLNGTSLTTAIAFNPGSGNRVAVETSLPCANTSTEKYAVTLEEAIAKYTGLEKCAGTKRTFSNGNGTSLNSGDRNEGWGNTTISLGTIGTALANYTDSTATAYYTTNTRLRAGLGANGAATFYSCKERYNGSPRNCDVIGTGSYGIKTVGDARTLSFTGLPSMASALDYTRVFVERGGKVYYGYQNRPMASNKAGLNAVASTALMAKLGLPAVNVDTPLALTLTSYQGTWDAYPDSDPTKIGETFTLSATGQLTCATAGATCAFTSFNPATGAFIATNIGPGASSSTITGTMNFLAGTAMASFVANNGSGTATLVRR